MSKCQYIIEGKEYDQERDFKSEILTFTLQFDLTAEIEKTDNGYIIELEEKVEELQDFEPQFLKKIATLMEITLYTKKNLQSSQTKINDQKIYKRCVQILRQDKVVAIKGNNSYHIVCNASKSKAVLALRDLISQPHKPLPVMYKNIQKARQLILLSNKEEVLLTSKNVPFVIARLRTLHRLEKVKYKHKLTPLINTINQRVSLSLPHNKLYQNLFEQIDFPLVSVDTNIIDKEKLIELYPENIDYILEDQAKIQELKPREVLQITYGKTQSIEPKIMLKKEAFHIVLDYEDSTIGNFKFKPFTLLKGNNPQDKALSLLFSKLSVEDILKLELPFSQNEILTLHKTWEKSTLKSNSLLDLFDAIVSLSGELHQKSFVDQSHMLVEEHYQACEENLCEFQITGNEIDINIISSYLDNNELKQLGPTLVNTIATISAQIAKEQNLDVHLSGRLFHYRDLSELTIEKLEDENIKATLS